MPRRALLLLALLAGCVTPSASAPPAGAGASRAEEADREPVPVGGRGQVEVRRMGVAEARARELAPLPLREVVHPGVSARGAVEAAGPLRYQAGPGATTLVIPLGTDSELLCFLYDAPLDAASALLSVARAVAGNAELSVQDMRVTEVREVGGVPAVFLAVDYRTALQGGGAARGQVKLMVRGAGEVPLLCAHDELGYTQSFRRITEALAVSLVASGGAHAGEGREGTGVRGVSRDGRGAATAMDERFNEIQALRLDGRPVGFAWRRLSVAPGGLRLVETTHSLLVPGARGAGLTAEDSTQVLVADGHGQTLQLSYAQARDGALTLELEATRGQGGTYRYLLTHEGRQLEGTFRARRGLTDALGALPRVREELLSGREPRVSVDVYEPALDPMGPTEAVYERTPGQAPEQGAGSGVTLTLGSRRQVGTLDARGLWLRSEVARESSTLTSERIFLRGAL